MARRKTSEQKARDLLTRMGIEPWWKQGATDEAGCHRRSNAGGEAVAAAMVASSSH